MWSSNRGCAVYVRCSRLSLGATLDSGVGAASQAACSVACEAQEQAHLGRNTVLPLLTARLLNKKTQY
jgi:hypothetical protein